MVRTDTDQNPGSHAGERRKARARATRNSRIRRASIVVGAVLAVVAVWAVAVAPGTSLITGDPSDGGSTAATGTPSAAATGVSTAATGTPTVGASATSGTRDPKLAKLDKQLSTSLPDASGFQHSPSTLGLGKDGFAPICGGPSPSDKLVLGAVTRTLTGKRAAGTVTILQSQAVYKAGGLATLLAEAARSSCVDRGDPLPNYPKGSVLLRGRGSSSVAYLVTATSDSTALYLKASSSAEEAVVDTLFAVVPGLVSQAQAGADKLIATVPK